MSALTYEVKDAQSPVAVWLRTTFPEHKEIQAECRVAAGPQRVPMPAGVAPVLNAGVGVSGDASYLSVARRCPRSGCAGGRGRGRGRRRVTRSKPLRGRTSAPVSPMRLSSNSAVDGVSTVSHLTPCRCSPGYE